MKVLVCGSSGLVGTDLCLYLEKQQISYLGIHNTRPQKNSYKVNLLQQDELNRFLDEHSPTICVNCIAERNVDRCETSWDKTKQVNVDIVTALAQTCAKRNIFFIHISTDYVFDGRSPPYSPDSQVNPLQNYGISKFLAECKVKTACRNYCILRVPVLYTNSYTKIEDTAVTVLAKKVMNQVETFQEDNYSLRRPVFIPDFCEFIGDCIQKKRNGTFHFYNAIDKTTKYEMCKTIGTFLQIPSTHIQPVNTPPANDAGRPYDTQFQDPQYNRSEYKNTHLEEGIRQCFQKFWHPRLSKALTRDLFFLLDLDGTLINTDRLHYEAYRDVLAEESIPLTWETYAQFTRIDQGILELVGEDRYPTIKARKIQRMKAIQQIQMIPGAEDLLLTLLIKNIPFAVVTNTGKETVDHFKQICPLLQSIQNWVTREDYRSPKPSSECYELAVAKYYRGELYIVGVENTVTGFKALQPITNRIYVVTSKESNDYKDLKNQDCYLVPDLRCFTSNVPK